jgi:hypothetical protein
MLMNRQLTWLQLSDLHARLRDDWDSREITNKMVVDLKALQETHGLRPDLVFFTGDLAFGAADGETMAHQYQTVRVFLDAVRKAFDPEIPTRDLYLVPGNHDVDRGEITAGETEWLRNPDRKIAEIIGAMEGRNKQWRTWMERLGNYRNFVTSYGLSHLTPDDPHLIWSDEREIAGVRVGIVGLNSAWSCADSQDKANLWCGADWQVSQLKQRMGPVAFAFALIHHPGNWLTPSEDPNAFRRLRQEFPIVFHGHEHQEWVEIDTDGRIILSAGACYESSWMPNGYSFGRIDLGTQKGEVWLRAWDGTGRGWVPRDIAGRTQNGIWPLKHLPWLGTPTRSTADALPEPATPTEPECGDADAHYALRFCQHVIEQYDVLELFGCDIPRELQKHQLSVAYVSLNLSQETEEEFSDGNRTKPPSKTSSGATETRDGDEPEADAAVMSSGIDLVLDRITEGSDRLMIRGPAGAGKSTLLRWCAIHAAQGILTGPRILAKASRISRDTGTRQEWREFVDANAYSTPNSWRFKIPILIRLRDCPDGKLPAAGDLPRFLAKHLPSAPSDWMTGVLESGRALVLLDGVDEIHRDKRPQLAEEIGELIRTHPYCTYVVTTRPGAVERGWLDRLEFVEARVEPMSRPDRHEFIEKWYRSAALELKHRPRPGEDLALTAARLIAELLDQPELGILASNPLLCAMICALYRERLERLPETPAELCEALIQMLLHRRERETPGLQDAHFPASWRALQYPQKKGILADLAWQMVKREEPAMDLLTAQAIVSDVLASTPGRTKGESPEIVQALVERSGLLRLASDDRIDFLHNTLKEYLAAGRIVEGVDWEFLTEHADDPTWQPVILFALALAPEQFSSSLVRRLLELVPTLNQGKKLAKNPSIPSKMERIALTEIKARDFFLVRCRAAAKRLAGDLSAGIDGLTTRLFPPVYMPEVEALAQLGSRILVHQAANLLNPGWWEGQDCRAVVRCLRLLRLIGGEKAATVLACIRRLPSYSAQVTGEWMMASSELCSASLVWPFALVDRVWADNTRVSDLRPLATLTSIKRLSLAFTNVNDLSPLSGLVALEILDIRRTRVTNLSPLSNLPSLSKLMFPNTPVRDLSPLEKSKSLKLVELNRAFLPQGEIDRFAKCRPDIKVQMNW